MRSALFIFLFAISNASCFGQSRSEMKKVAHFKNDYLRKAKLNQSDTLGLDSVMLIRKKTEDGRTIKTIRKHTDVILQEGYYNLTTQIKSIKTTDSIGYPKGIAEYYTREGTLDYTEDYDKGEWIVYEKEKHPYYELQAALKIKADSLLSKMYGYHFLIDHTVWSVGGSYLCNEKEMKRWTELPNNEPTGFLFCYQVNFEGTHGYSNDIYFKLDKDGNFLPDHKVYGFFNPGYGFESIPENLKGSFRLKYADALSKAKSLGLKETDSVKAYGRLYWEEFKKGDIINGQYRLYIIMQTATKRNEHPDGHYFSVTKYDVYSFSPWSGDFVEIKKMKTTASGGGERRSFTDLIPDKE